MAWAEPELDDGAEEDDPMVPDDEPLVPDEVLPVLEPPEVACVADEREPDFADVLDALDGLWVELGRVKARPPATARPSTPVPAVTARSRLRARSRFTTAVTVRGSLLFIMSPSRKLTPLTCRNGLWRGFPLPLWQL